MSNVPVLSSSNTIMAQTPSTSASANTANASKFTRTNIWIDYLMLGAAGLATVRLAVNFFSSNWVSLPVEAVILAALTHGKAYRNQSQESLRESHDSIHKFLSEHPKELNEIRVGLNNAEEKLNKIREESEQIQTALAKEGEDLLDQTKAAQHKINELLREKFE